MEKRINKVHIDGDYTKLKPGEGVEGYEYGADLDSSTPLIDPGEGKTVSIRVFEFKMNPEASKRLPMTKQAIFNSHAKQISAILWGDGLIPLESVSPRVIINKRARSYQIFIPCEAKRGVLFSHKDQPKNLSEALKNENTRHSK